MQHPYYFIIASLLVGLPLGGLGIFVYQSTTLLQPRDARRVGIMCFVTAVFVMALGFLKTLCVLSPTYNFM